MEGAREVRAYYRPCGAGRSNELTVRPTSKLTPVRRPSPSLVLPRRRATRCRARRRCEPSGGSASWPGGSSTSGCTTEDVAAASHVACFKHSSSLRDCSSDFALSMPNSRWQARTCSAPGGSSTSGCTTETSLQRHMSNALSSRVLSRDCRRDCAPRAAGALHVSDALTAIPPVAPSAFPRPTALSNA